jgi:hypothetical protein
VPSPPTCGSGAHERRSRYGRTAWAQVASITKIVRRRRRGGSGQVYGHLQVVQGRPTARRAAPPGLGWPARRRLGGRARDLMALSAMPGWGASLAAGRCEGGGELLARGDCELLVGAGEVPIDSPGGDEQVLGDVAFGQTGGGELGDAALAGRQRVEPAEDGPPGSAAGAASNSPAFRERLGQYGEGGSGVNAGQAGVSSAMRASASASARLPMRRCTRAR